MNPKLSIVIVNYKSEDALEHCLRSLNVATTASLEVMIVDNSPLSRNHDPVGGKSAAKILEESGVNGYYFPQSENTGYTKAANLGARHAHGDFICFLNPDTVLNQHALDRMLDWVEQHPRTVVGPRELDGDGRVITSSFPFVTRRYIWGSNFLYKIPWPRSWHPWLPWLVPPFRYARTNRRATQPTKLPVLSGSCLLMKKSTWDEVGDHRRRRDPAGGGGWHNQLTYFGLESEWFQRAREFGVTAWYLPNATMFHEHALSIKRGVSWRVRAEANQNRKWHARKKGLWVLGILIAILWIERRFKPRSRSM